MRDGHHVERAVDDGCHHVRGSSHQANSILLVTFAREQREAGMSAFDAAMSAGTTRLRPVLMTAAAMIVGMIPMAIGGPGEEQNAVLARAVIGGVAVGTMTTLLFVPYLYSVIGQFERRRAAQPLAAQGHDMNEQSPTPPDSLLRDSEQATPADPAGANAIRRRRRPRAGSALVLPCWSQVPRSRRG